MTPSSGASFEELQRAFTERVGRRSPADLDSGTMVVVPSISFVSEELRKITAIQYYEERMLCMLLFLEAPDLNIVFVSSMPVDESIIDYYLSFLDDPPAARRRAVFVSVDDPEARGLTEKLLTNRDALGEIQERLDGVDDAFILPFNVTELERRLAEELGVPLYGPHPDLVPLGSKSGSRRVARDAGVPVLPGAEDLFSLEELEKAVAALRTACPEARSIVMKLNNGFSGQGNAILDLAGIASPLNDSPTVFCAEAESWESYARKIAEGGVVVEQLIQNPRARSPSVQLRIVPGGAYEIVSTHDQILGGPDEQVYLGCRFPANREYRPVIQEHARRIAEVLSARGVIGSFGIDFVVIPNGSTWDAYLSEINLRLGGTTHPFLMARRVTRGFYDETTGELVADGKTKTYVAGDNFKSSDYVGLVPRRVMSALRESGLAFDVRRGGGVTLHLLGALPEYGKLGALCIADDPAEAESLYKQVGDLLDELAHANQQARRT
jgi:hypothetical protein